METKVLNFVYCYYKSHTDLLIWKETADLVSEVDCIHMYSICLGEWFANAIQFFDIYSDTRRNVMFLDFDTLPFEFG